MLYEVITYAMLNVQGPHSRDLLQRLCRADLSHAAFPFASVRDLDLGSVHIRVR